MAKTLIMLHGRGATSGDILSLAGNLQVTGYTLLAPQAPGNTWYPCSFLAPPAQNEPWLSESLSKIADIVEEQVQQAIPKNDIYFLGFSQGACLMLEFLARHATRYGGAVAFTGGLIGDKIYPENYTGSLSGTPIFLGTSDPDPHIPVARVYATTNILQDMHGAVTTKIYGHMGHTINEDELEQANKIVFSH